MVVQASTFHDVSTSNAVPICESLMAPAVAACAGNVSGYAGQDVMRIQGSCSAVTLEMTLNIVKGFLPPLISCCANGTAPRHASDGWVEAALIHLGKCNDTVSVYPCASVTPSIH